MKTIASLFTLSLAVLSLTSCAHSDRAIIAEARQEPATQSATELESRLSDLILNDAALSAEKKKALLAVVERVTRTNEEAQTLINQKKSLLVKELLSPNYNHQKVESIKKSVIKLHDQKMKNSLNGLEEMKEILGHLKDPQILFQKMLDLGGRR